MRHSRKSKAEAVSRLIRLCASRVSSPREGTFGSVARWFFLRLVWTCERLTGRRGASLRKTRRRLYDKLALMVQAANTRERLRRAENVVEWVLLGLVCNEQLAQEVAAYEVSALR